MAMHDHLNIRRGDVVGIWSSNVYDWIVIQYACLRLGAILCTANPFYQSHELDYAIRKGEMKALFMPGKQSKQNEVNDFFKIIRETLRNKSEVGYFYFYFNEFSSFFLINLPRMKNFHFN